MQSYSSQCWVGYEGANLLEMPHCLPPCWFLIILGWNQRWVKEGLKSSCPPYNRPKRGTAWMPGQRGRLDSTDLPDSSVVVARETKTPSKQEVPEQFKWTHAQRQACHAKIRHEIV